MALLLLLIINPILLAVCGMWCLYPISPIGETVPWPGKNPYSKPSIRRSVYIQFNETPFNHLAVRLILMEGMSKVHTLIPM